MTTKDTLVEAAAALFYAEGIHACGIDRVVERSGFSKPTLYKYFRSKGELVTAVLERRAQTRRKALEALVDDPAQTPRQALEAVIEYFVDWYAEENYRGCALINGAVELPDPAHPGRETVREHKEWMTGFLAELATAAGLREPQELAQSLVLLEEGATVMAYVGTQDSVGGQLRRAAGALLAAHQPVA